MPPPTVSSLKIMVSQLVVRAINRALLMSLDAALLHRGCMWTSKEVAVLLGKSNPKSAKPNQKSVVIPYDEVLETLDGALNEPSFQARALDLFSTLTSTAVEIEELKREFNLHSELLEEEIKDAWIHVQLVMASSRFPGQMTAASEILKASRTDVLTRVQELNARPLVFSSFPSSRQESPLSFCKYFVRPEDYVAIHVGLLEFLPQVRVIVERQILLDLLLDEVRKLNMVEDFYMKT